MHKKVLFILLLTLCLACGLLSAQDKINYDYARSGYAIQVAIDNDFTLAPFSGMMISLKKSLSGKSALRIGISLENAILDQEQIYHSGSNNYRNSSRDEVIIGLDLKYIYNRNISRPVSFYIGAGPKFSYDYNFIKSEQNTTSYTYVDNIAVFGLTACWGAEWQLGHRLSLTAEYGLSMEFTDWSEKRHGRETEVDIVEIRAQNILLGLSVYL